MSIFDRDKPKIVTVSRDYDPYVEPYVPDYNLPRDPNLSEIDDSNTAKTSVITDSHFPWLQTLYDSMPPTRGDFTTHQLLARIADLLSQSRQVDVPSDFMSLRSRTFPANQPGEFIIEGITQYGYIYMPPHTIEIDVWLGHGRGQPLISVTAGQSLNGQIPHVDVITLTFTTGINPETIFAYPSTRPFRLETA